MTSDEADAVMIDALAWISNLTEAERMRFADDLGELLGAVMRYELSIGKDKGQPVMAVTPMLIAFQYGGEVAVGDTDAPYATDEGGHHG